MKLIIDIDKEEYEECKQYLAEGVFTNWEGIIANGTPVSTDDDLISRSALTEAEKIICKMYLEDLDKFHTCNEYKLLMSLIDNASTVEHSLLPLLPLESDIDSAYMRGYEVGKAEGILKANTRPQGEWIKNEGRDLRDCFYTCSKCGRSINVICGETLADYPFCHCGAEMKGGAE